MSMDMAGRRSTKVAKLLTDILFWSGLAVIVATAGGLVFRAVTGRFIFLLPGFVIPIVALALVAIWWLRAFLRDVLADRVFTILNARRLRRIGWLLIATALIKPLMVFIVPGVFSGGRLQMAALFFELQFMVPVLLALLTDSYLLAGVLLLVIGSAWRYGSELQQDRDYTV